MKEIVIVQNGEVYETAPKKRMSPAVKAIIGGATIAALSFAVFACGDNGSNGDNTPTPPPVVEQDKFYDAWVNGIAIYQGADVTDQQVEDIIENFDNKLSNAQQIRLAGHIIEIHVTKNSGEIRHEEDVLYVGYDTDITDIKSYLFNEGLLAQNQHNDVMVAVDGKVDVIMSVKLARHKLLDRKMNEKQA